MINIPNRLPESSPLRDSPIPCRLALTTILSRPYSVELQKANLEGSSTSTGTGTSNAAAPLASAIPLAQLLSKPAALGALSSLTALGGLTELLSGNNVSQPVQTTGVHRNHKNFNQRRQDDETPTKGNKERAKYNPY